MSTVYNIKIKTVSMRIAYTPEFIEEKLNEFLEGLKCENTKIEVK